MTRGFARLGPLASNSIVQASGANFVILGLTLASGVIVARSLGAEGRGHYAAIMAWFSLALVLGELGQSGAVTYHVSRYAHWRRDLVKSSQTMMGLAGIVVAAGGVLAADLLAGGDSGVAAAYRVSFLGCLINAIGAPYVYAMQAISIRAWNIMRLVQPIAYLVFILVTVLAVSLNLFSLALIIVGSTSAQMAWAWWACSRLGITGGSTRSKLRWPLLKYGLAYSGSSLPLAASAQIDKLALSRMVAPADLGLYAVASTMASMASPFSTAIASVLFPRIARRDVELEGKRALENRSLVLTFSVSILVSVIVASTAPWVIPWVFGAEFAGAAVLAWWLVPAMVLRGCSQVVSAHVRGRGRPGIVSWAQCAGLLCATIGVLTLTPLYGMAGTAIGIALSEVVVLVWTYAALAKVRGKGESQNPSQPKYRNPKHGRTSVSSLE